MRSPFQWRLYRRWSVLYWFVMAPFLLLWFFVLHEAVFGRAHPMDGITLPLKHVPVAVIHFRALSVNGQPVEAWGRFLHLALLTVSGFAGYLLGRVVLGEVQHAWFSFTLPRARRRLAESLVSVGGLFLLVEAAGYAFLGGPLSPPEALALAALAFSCGVLLARTLDRGPGGLLPLAAGTALWLWVDPVAGFLGRDPWAAVPACLGAAAAIIAWCFTRTAARDQPSRHLARAGGAVLPALGILKPKSLDEPLGEARGVWTGGRPGTSPYRWIRAISYQNSRGLRGGEVARTVILAFATLGFVALLALVGASQDAGTVREAVRTFALGILLVPSRVEESHVSAWMVYWCISYGFLIYSVNSAFTLRPGWAYPLSRDDRARITWLGSLAQALGLVVAVAAIFLGTAIALTAFTGAAVAPQPGGGLVRALAGSLIFLPLLQWISVRYPRFDSRGCRRFHPFSITVMAVFPILAGYWAWLWPTGRLRLPGPVSAAVILGLLVISQDIFHRVLRRHFRHADLT